MSHTYEIDSNNAIKCFAEGSSTPHLLQPRWPNGEAWKDADEAKAWADLYLASENDPNAPYAPNARGTTGNPKPTQQQIDAIKNLKNAKTAQEKEIALASLKTIVGVK